MKMEIAAIYQKIFLRLRKESKKYFIITYLLDLWLNLTTDQKISVIAIIDDPLKKSIESSLVTTIFLKI